MMSKKTEQQAEEPKKKPPITFKESYPVVDPYGFVGIQMDKETGKLQYLTIEPTMDEHEKQNLRRLKTNIKEEANVPLSVLKDEALIEDYLTNQIKRATKTFKLKISEDSVEKFIYYMKRDFLGYVISSSSSIQTEIRK